MKIVPAATYARRYASQETKMNEYTFYTNIINSVADIIGHLSWPIACIILACMFRRPLIRLILRTKQLTAKFGKNELSINRYLQENTGKVKTAKPEEIPDNIKNKLLSGNHKEAINEAYKLVDDSITKGAQFGFFAEPVPYEPAQKAGYLAEREVITKDQADAFNTLSTIQSNLSKPKSQFYTDPSSGWNYVSQAVGLAKEFDDTWSVIDMSKIDKSNSE